MRTGSSGQGDPAVRSGGGVEASQGRLLAVDIRCCFKPEPFATAAVNVACIVEEYEVTLAGLLSHHPSGPQDAAGSGPPHSIRLCPIRLCSRFSHAKYVASRTLGPRSRPLVRGQHRQPTAFWAMTRKSFWTSSTAASPVIARPVIGSQRPEPSEAGPANRMGSGIFRARDLLLVG